MSDKINEALGKMAGPIPPELLDEINQAREDAVQEAALAHPAVVQRIAELEAQTPAWVSETLLAREKALIKAERERDEAREDTARLDWLEGHTDYPLDYWDDRGREMPPVDWGPHVPRTLREAIDAARGEWES